MHVVGSLLLRLRICCHKCMHTGCFPCAGTADACVLLLPAHADLPLHCTHTNLLLMQAHSLHQRMHTHCQ